MKTFKVLDFIGEVISNRKMHPAGYMILPDCVIARSGILKYDNVICSDGTVVNDGAVVTVYRPPSALKKCLSHFNGLPLTMTHPKENMVDPNSFKSVVVGTVGTNARIEESKDGEVIVVADIIVHDKDAIASLNEKKNEELSAGYETSYRKERGVTSSGESYEAVQFYLMPNHVALVEAGRCGNECRVCDHDDIPKSQKEKNKMAKKNERGIFRYFLVGDSEEAEATEITEEVSNKLEEEGVEVEELDEDEVQIEEESADPEIIEEDEEEDDIEDDEVEIIEEDEDEEIVESAGSDEIFEVELDDGTIGKMDKVAYEYFKRYMDMQKKGDATDSAASIMALTATAGRVLGEGFAVDSYIKGGKFNAKKLKLDVIKKQMPEVVTTSLRNDEAIDSLFDTAVKSAKRNVTDWRADMMNLATAKTIATDRKSMSPVEEARIKRLKIINRKGE